MKSAEYRFLFPVIELVLPSGRTKLSSLSGFRGPTQINSDHVNQAAVTRPVVGLPGCEERAIGRPLVSTTAWVLAFSPPLKRPKHLWSGLFPAVGSGGKAALFGVRTVLADADGGEIDHLDVAVVGLRDRLEDAVPHAVFRASNEAVVAGLERAAAVRDVGPGPKPVCRRQQMQFSTVLSSARSTLRGLPGNKGR